MRIPLDYYRIIGLPLQATAEQIEQAYQDRLRQTPHSELTQDTLEARNQLLGLAYEVLSDPEKRSEYDANYLLTSYPMGEEETIALPHIQSEEEEALALAPHTPVLDIKTPEELLGALLILYELGEYERVCHLADKVLTAADEYQFSRPMEGDLILILALAYWELGRELWRQEQYEFAGEAVERGHQVLVSWDLFPQLRQEMAAELDKLCPYRIFELLQKRDRSSEDAVTTAIALLETMFEKRGGIDGEKPDNSGLDVDEFLLFVQQIQEYLTTAEQEALFAKEAQRTSSVAMYLAACSGIARGFAYLEPYSIRQAQKFLQQLERDYRHSDRADVHLEQSICALLLGDTETALAELEKSQETQSIEQIEAYANQAADAPDFLLGLCKYAEHWLESFLFPKFLDLAEQEASLKDYFASESVQSTLEAFQQENNPSYPPENDRNEEETQTSFFSHLTEESSSSLEENDSPEDIPQQPQRKPRHRRPQRRLQFKSPVTRIIALVVASGVGLGVIAVVVFGFYRGVSALWSTLFNRESPQLEGSPLALELKQLPVALPESDPQQITLSSEVLNRGVAERIIRTWLSAKAQALGPEYRSNALDEILTQSLLPAWKSRSQQFKNRNTYQQFRHSVSVESFSYSPNTPDQGQVVATVREVAKFYRNGNQVESQAYSYDSTLKVRYDVVRENENWRIQGITVL